MTEREKALVVDDVKIDLVVLDKLLRFWDFDTSLASSGGEAMALLKAEQHFSLYLVDWNMPTVSGIELVKEIRARNAPGKIVMITGKNDLEHVKVAIEAGVDEYIMKPITKEILREKLALVGFPLPNDKAPHD